MKEKYKDKLFSSEELFAQFCKHLEDRRLHKIQIIKMVFSLYVNINKNVKTRKDIIEERDKMRKDPFSMDDLIDKVCKMKYFLSFVY